MAMSSFNPKELKLAREEQRLDQEQLALRVGCRRNTISRAEHGKCSDRLVEQIANALRQPVSRFYRKPAAAGNLTDDQRDILDLVTGLSPESLHDLKTMALALRQAELRRPRLAPPPPPEPSRL